ncbi:unnamed protein product [Ceratitis capitata]|uniref:(Mediterranean fruit fly) hypothetical protein n=1 Tax=Ceratitis capitata TaxID=7213 RepID=A0A811UGF2_CERCA|nr:unnamed protein product [Ceratitis capitata]
MAGLYIQHSFDSYIPFWNTISSSQIKRNILIKLKRIHAISCLKDCSCRFNCPAECPKVCYIIVYYPLVSLHANCLLPAACCLLPENTTTVRIVIVGDS